MRKKIIIVIIILFVFIGGKAAINFAKFSPVLLGLLFHKDIALKKTNEQINILLLGIGGGKHEGPNLSDSIIFASINPQKNTVSLISIPRDLWIPDLNAKINTAYATGEEKRKGGGLLLSRAVVAKVLGQQIDYGIRVDFDGFIKAVDLIGGIDVAVERTVDDYEYPIEGKENDTCGHTDEDIPKLATSSSQLEAFPCRYMHIHFDKGQQHMDGITALRFVRSRHAKGVEGTDFARSNRQEKIIQGFKNRVLSIDTLLNPLKVISLFTTFSDNVDTDIPQSEIDDFVRLADKMREATIRSAVLDYGDTTRSGLLVNPPISSDYRSAWVLIPRKGNGNFMEVREYVTCIISTGTCSITPSTKQ